jgi:hypothetical protein
MEPSGQILYRYLVGATFLTYFRDRVEIDLTESFGLCVIELGFEYLVQLHRLCEVKRPIHKASEGALAATVFEAGQCLVSIIFSHSGIAEAI